MQQICYIYKWQLRAILPKFYFYLVSYSLLEQFELSRKIVYPEIFFTKTLRIFILCARDMLFSSALAGI